MPMEDLTGFAPGIDATGAKIVDDVLYVCRQPFAYQDGSVPRVVARGTKLMGSHKALKFYPSLWIAFDAPDDAVRPELF